MLADDQAVYAPRDYNDQLLLGLKGTMAEAESVWLRRRLHGGKLSKARRGELFQNPAVGYVWDGAGQCFVFDPDAQVQRAVRLVFQRFRADGSTCGVARYFHQHGVQFPIIDSRAGAHRWSVPSPSTICRMLHNPVYAGAYVFGRTEERAALVDGTLRRRHLRRLPREQWTVCLRQQHPGYIDWEEFMANQRTLHENRSNHAAGDQRGAAREGEALLQGLALCGRCGRRMSVIHPEPGRATYVCQGQGMRVGKSKGCWSVRARAVDTAIAALFLDAVQPGEIELGLAVAREAERQAGELHAQWKLRLQRLEYEARLAERRYKAVDPDNRVVAATLESDWERRLHELESARAEYAEARERQRLDIGDRERKQILRLARDLPALWQASTTTMAERKHLVRLVVREVSMAPEAGSRRRIRVRVLWETENVTDLVVERPDGGRHFATPDHAREVVRGGFGAGRSDDEMATALNAESVLTGRRRRWDGGAVARVRQDVGLFRPKGPPPARRADGLYSLRGVATRFEVHEDTVQYWVDHGWLVAVERGGHGRPNWYRLDAATVRRINARRHRGHFGNHAAKGGAS